MTMAMTDTQVGFIDVRNIGVTFGANDNKVVAVENVSINVQPGEFVSLIGPSGCGKSTLLSIVAGFQKPTQEKPRSTARRSPGPDRIAASCSSNTRFFHGCRFERTSSSA